MLHVDETILFFLSPNHICFNRLPLWCESVCAPVNVSLQYYISVFGHFSCRLNVLLQSFVLCSLFFFFLAQKWLWFFLVVMTWNWCHDYFIYGPNRKVVECCCWFAKGRTASFFFHIFFFVFLTLKWRRRLEEIERKKKPTTTHTHNSNYCVVFFYVRFAAWAFELYFVFFFCSVERNVTFSERIVKP